MFSHITADDITSEFKYTINTLNYKERQRLYEHRYIRIYVQLIKNIRCSMLNRYIDNGTLVFIAKNVNLLKRTYLNKNTQKHINNRLINNVIEYEINRLLNILNNYCNNTM